MNEIPDKNLVVHELIHSRKVASTYIFGSEKKFTACGIQVGALGTDSTEGGRRSMNFWMKSTSP